jgi:hypothetical protein
VCFISQHRRAAGYVTKQVVMAIRPAETASPTPIVTINPTARQYERMQHAMKPCRQCSTPLLRPAVKFRRSNVPVLPETLHSFTCGLPRATAQAAPHRGGLGSNPGYVITTREGCFRVLGLPLPILIPLTAP